MVLSIGIMAKNEEKYLEKCLIGLKPILDSIDSELVIVDTGSTDKTAEIAKKYTEKVYFHEWDNDFSNMRNKVLSHCSGEWFLFVDADEIFVDVNDLVLFFNSNEYKKYNSASIIIKSYCDNNSSVYVNSPLLRLFKKSEDFNFIGKIHEQPRYKSPIKYLKSIANHYGYIGDDKSLMERKFIRNKKLLIEELDEKPDNIYLNFQLSKTYSMYGKSDKAITILEKVYNSMNNNHKMHYKYILLQYAKLLLKTRNYIECERVCEKELKLIKNSSIYKIDLYNYLGKSKHALMKYKESINCFNKYFELIDELDNEKIQLDVTAANETYIYKNDTHKFIIFNFIELKSYDEAIRYYQNLKSIIKVEDIVVSITKAYIKIKDFKGLYNFYREDIVESNEEIYEKFLSNLEQEKLKLSKQDNSIIEKIFAQDDENYGLINQIRIMKDVKENYNKLINKNNENELYFSELLYIALKEKYSVLEFVNKSSYSLLSIYIDYCDKKYNEEFTDMLLEYCKTNKSNSFDSLRVNIIFLRSILILDKISEEKYYELFNEYIINGNEFICLIYSEYIIQNELVHEIKNGEHQFFMHMKRAEKFKNSDKISYLKELKKALKAYPVMKKGIKSKINEANKQTDDEMKVLKKELIANIKFLMQCGKIEDTKAIILEYEKFMGEDNDILLLKQQLDKIL